MKIAALVGSVRRGAVGTQIGQWIAAEAEGMEGLGEFTVDVLNLADFDLPIFDGEVPPAALNKAYTDERVARWSRAIDAADAFLFITPEYNHGVPGAMKNAVDHLGSEWNGKPVGYVGYSYTGGIRAVENWRHIMNNFNGHQVRNEVNIYLASALDSEGKFHPSAENEAALRITLRDVVKAVR